MTHLLRQRHPLHAVSNNPLIASLRYRCQCTGGEVLQIQVVLDMECDEQKFLWTMKQLWRDVQFEVEQHITNATKVVADGQSTGGKT
jgi:hypothetical protein